MTRTLMVTAALTTVLLSQPSFPEASPGQGRDTDFRPASPESQGLSDESLRSLASVDKAGSKVEKEETFLERGVLYVLRLK